MLDVKGRMKDELKADWCNHVERVCDPDAEYERAFRTAYNIVIRRLATLEELVEWTRLSLMVKLERNRGIADGSDGYTAADFERIARHMRDIMSYPVRVWPGFAEALDVVLTECWSAYEYRLGGERYHMARQSFETRR